MCPAVLSSARVFRFRSTTQISLGTKNSQCDKKRTFRRMTEKKSTNWCRKNGLICFFLSMQLWRKTHVGMTGYTMLKGEDHAVSRAKAINAKPKVYMFKQT